MNNENQIKPVFLIPWNFLLIVLVIAMRYLKIDMTLGSIPSICVLIGAILVMVLEFIRSGDILFKNFIIDTSLSNLALIGSSWYVAYLVFKGIPLHFVEYLAYAIIILDAWLSPINGFRTALRNFQIGNN